ncbi:hypothetical protein E2C01_020783 [Portunus trituberculatus]|uniref:Uncharacterized protein n=1 Tax=Portunus trituberculatus TaxID=210409 RepID=A0A5B7E140_PORTR|nr:hypothetical protein [Portunus trituberculatus]
MHIFGQILGAVSPRHQQQHQGRQHASQGHLCTLVMWTPYVYNCKTWNSQRALICLSPPLAHLHAAFWSINPSNYIPMTAAQRDSTTTPPSLSARHRHPFTTIYKWGTSLQSPSPSPSPSHHHSISLQYPLPHHHTSIPLITATHTHAANQPPLPSIPPCSLFTTTTLFSHFLHR